MRREVLMRQTGREGRNLKRHIKTLFKGNTDEGTQMKLGDWDLFCRPLYDKEIPRLEDVTWLPGKDAWRDFLVDSRSTGVLTQILSGCGRERM